MVWASAKQVLNQGLAFLGRGRAQRLPSLLPVSVLWRGEGGRRVSTSAVSSFPSSYLFSVHRRVLQRCTLQLWWEMGQHPGGFNRVGNLAVPGNTLLAYTFQLFCIRSVKWVDGPHFTGDVMEIHREMSLCLADAQPEITLQGCPPCIPLVQLPASAQAQEPWQSLCSRSRCLSRNTECGY